MGSSHWTKPESSHDSLKIITELALLHAANGGKQGRYIADHIIGHRFSALCNFDLDYSDITLLEARNCRQALGYFTKCAFLDFGIDKRAVAVEKFKQAERTCAETNEFFKALAQGSLQIEPWFDRVLFRAQKKIANVLGEIPLISDLKYRFGPGATTLTKKRDASAVEKLQAGISCSPNLLPLSGKILAEMPHFRQLHSVKNEDDEWATSVLVQHGVVEFVPKNAKTHRSIVKEPSLNTMCQLALGDYMAKRLAAFGIDIKDQTKNQKLALIGSLDGSLATLDLSSASDTISTELVYHLLPIDWALSLDFCRSETVVLDDELITMEKFSSMGNGFTFPLETLIFWALSSSCAEDNFASVYGDDIIVRTGDVPLVLRVLKACGFTINEDKSYWTGPFRESCGADYLSGFDIRPFYQRELISGSSLFLLHNFYRRNLDYEMAERVLKLIHPSLQIFGPDGFGDGHLLGDWFPKSSKRQITHGYGGVTFDTFKLQSRRDKRRLRPGDFVFSLYSIYSSSSSDFEEMEPTITENDLVFSYKNRFLRNGPFKWANLEIPESKDPGTGLFCKEPSLPGTRGYKRLSIYTFDTI